MRVHEQVITTIKSWAEDDRPREKLRDKGRGNLSDAELLAIILGSGNADESAVDLAKRMLKSVDNNLAKLAALDLDQLKKFRGVGEAKAIAIQAALEIGRRRAATTAGDEELRILTSTDAFRIIKPELQDLQHEEFWIILLNRRNVVLRKESISRGGVHGTLVDPKLVFKLALRHHATGLVLCHNHPSGMTDPSDSDKRLTRRLQEGAQLLDITIVDHIIVGQHTHFSFADQGLL